MAYQRAGAATLVTRLTSLLNGPKGCGKTVLARAIAASLGMEFAFFNCGAVVEATDLLATIQVRANASLAPVTDFVKTDVLIALEDAIGHPERRYLIFLDEFNRCQESARVRKAPELSAGLSVRATDEACVYLKHPLLASQRSALLPEVLKSSFCGRFSGKWSGAPSGAGAVWAIVENALRERKLLEDT